MSEGRSTPEKLRASLSGARSSGEKIRRGYVLIGGALGAPALITAAWFGGYEVEEGIDPVKSVLVLLLFALPFVLWGILTLRTGFRDRRVFERGVPALGRVLGMSRTGRSVNDVPEMRIEIEVQAGGALDAEPGAYRTFEERFKTGVVTLVTPEERALLTPGTFVRVRVDPARPESAVFD